MSFVGRPQFDLENKALKYIFNNNQLGIIATANNGEMYNIITSQDLNGDGILVDRPVSIVRNSGRTPKQFDVDLRYSRFVTAYRKIQIGIFRRSDKYFQH